MADPLSKDIRDFMAENVGDGEAWARAGGEVAGIDVDAKIGAATADLASDADLAAHVDAVTSVHGIPDTSALATTEYVDEVAGSSVEIDDLPLADPLSGDEVVPIVQDGETRKTTTSDLAMVGAVATIPAQAMFSASGTPSLTVVNRHQMWLLDPDSNEGLGFDASAFLPAAWSTFHVDVVWVNRGTDSGNISLRIDSAPFGAGTSIANPTNGPVGAHAAAGQNVVVVSTVTNTLNAPDAGNSLSIVLFRIGTNLADTLAADAGILEVRLVKET